MIDCLNGCLIDELYGRMYQLIDRLQSDRVIYNKMSITLSINLPSCDCSVIPLQWPWLQPKHMLENRLTGSSTRWSMSRTDNRFIGCIGWSIDYMIMIMWLIDCSTDWLGFGNACRMIRLLWFWKLIVRHRNICTKAGSSTPHRWCAIQCIERLEERHRYKQRSLLCILSSEWCFICVVCWT